MKITGQERANVVGFCAGGILSAIVAAYLAATGSKAINSFTQCVTMLDFRTDASLGAFRLPTPPEVGPMRIRFLGVNQRHHSLALMPVPAGKDPGLIHIMVEVDTLDAVGRALDRVTREGYSVSSTLGRHTNDKMVSFYVRAPGGWDIEFGTEGMLVDESHFTAEEITADSYWGHDWSGSEPLAAFTPKS